ncbi:Phosphatidylinositol transfer protein C [Sesamum angolense]|uniref:Phosphatidylinositol transfer protein C n=1 Tax=Sesamum angolense TaxID=2727404 RepID=A0AAE1WZD0_9LAMI|nr:Phosphatidylinositol transfer protein C [Sesamum angolense]
MAQCLRLRPPLLHHFKTFAVRSKKPTKIFKLGVRSCSLAPENAHKRWRHEFRVSELSEESVKIAAETGKAYVHNYPDVYGRPVLIVEAAKHFPGKQEPREDEKLCVFMIEKALSKLPAGKQEILGIIDLRGFQTQNADLKFLIFVFDAFYYYYPRRLGQVLFVDAPFVFKPVWQLVKPLLKSYASLVRFCSAKTVREEYFTADILPPIFRN